MQILSDSEDLYTGRLVKFQLVLRTQSVFVNSKSHGLAINMTSFFHGGPVVR